MNSIILLGLIACFSLLLICQVYLYSASLMREGLEDNCNLKDYRDRLNELEKRQGVTDADLRAMIQKQKDGEEELNSAVNIEADPDEINNME